MTTTSVREADAIARIRAHVTDLLSRSPWYRHLLHASAITAEDIHTGADVLALPFTTKDQLAAHNERFRCVGPERIIDHVFTSGSTGDPVPFVLSENDLQRLAMNEERSLRTAGLRPDDVVQITTTLDKRFMAGMAYWLGLRSMGAGIVRSGPGHAAGQWDTAIRCGSTALIMVPSYALRMLDEWKQAGLDPARTRIRKVICIGEPIGDGTGAPNALARRINELCAFELHGTYASTEMATACTERSPFKGHLVPQDLMHIEVLGDDDRPVADGQPGEVVATPYGVEAMPLLRFRTGDICTVRRVAAADGAMEQLLGPLLGRKDQRMKLKGTTLWPQQVIDALNAEASILRYCVLREHDAHGLDTLRVLVHTAENDLAPMTDRLRDRLRVLPVIEHASAAAIEALVNDPRKRKPSPFIDHSAHPSTTKP